MQGQHPWRIKARALQPHLGVQQTKTSLCVAQDLANRYGKPLIVLNLVKVAEKRPRESILQSEFANAISYINKGVSPCLGGPTH